MQSNSTSVRQANDIFHRRGIRGFRPLSTACLGRERVPDQAPDWVIQIFGREQLAAALAVGTSWVTVLGRWAAGEIAFLAHDTVREPLPGWPLPTIGDLAIREKRLRQALLTLKVYGALGNIADALPLVLRGITKDNARDLHEVHKRYILGPHSEGKLIEPQPRLPSRRKLAAIGGERCRTTLPRNRARTRRSRPVIKSTSAGSGDDPPEPPTPRRYLGCEVAP